MRHWLINAFSGFDPPLRRRALLMCAGLLAANALVWLWALAALRGHAALLGTAFLAYSLGLRHAVDADHIAAIDNSTRKLMQLGQKPLGIGLFFSLGHSAVVVLMSVAVALATSEVDAHLAGFKAVGGLVSTFASAAFLFLLALFNIGVLASIWRTFKKVRNGAPFAQDEFDVMLGGRGLLTKLFRPLFALVTKSWHLFPIGFVFGLGFDTATEVALLGMAATQAAQGASLAALLVFPALFTVGMSLVDALDGMFMLNAYGWAFLKPMRKLYYNLVITALSVVVALLIGSIETLGRIGDAYKFEGAFWDAIGALNGNFGALGYAIIALFALSWAASALVYRFGGYEALEAGA